LTDWAWLESSSAAAADSSASEAVVLHDPVHLDEPHWLSWFDAVSLFLAGLCDILDQAIDLLRSFSATSSKAESVWLTSSAPVFDLLNIFRDHV
jgi:hypothetical protein